MRSAALMLGVLFFVAGAGLATDGTPGTPITRTGAETDAAGNVVRTESGELVMVPKEAAPDIDALAPVPAAPSGTSVVTNTAPGLEEFYSLDLDRVWTYSIWGTSLGRTGMEPADLDGDGRLEIVMGSSISGGFSSNSAWFVLQHDPASGDYVMVWSSGPVEAAVTRVRVLTTGGRPRIFIGRADGNLMVHDGATRALEVTLAAAGSAINDILLADADNDGQQELVLVTQDSLHLLDPITYAEESQLPYGGYEAAVGNVDADPALEIVLVSGPVLEFDGSVATLEWDFSAFGTARYLGLTDLDADGMQEIVAARGWYYIDVYDVDLQSPKSQFLADLDIQALLLRDVTGDGKDEILYGDGQWGSIHALDALSGTELWAIANPEHGTTRIAIADTDDDGDLEVMWGAGWTSTGEDFFFVHDLASKALEFQSFDLVGPFAAVAMGDADDDGSDEIVAISSESNSGYADGVIHVFDAETFELEWRSETALFGRCAWTGVHDVAIGDVDGDGGTEIVVGTDRLYDGTIYVIDGKTHAVEAKYLYDDGSPISALALEDFDGDGKMEIVAGNFREHTGSPGVFLYVIDGASGVVEWKSVSLASGWSGVYALEVADVDGDGFPDAVLSADSLYVISGATHVVRKTASTGFYGLDVADFDGDGNVEIWAGTSGGGLVRVDPLSMSVSSVVDVCSSRVNSVKLDRTSSLAGSIQFACDDDLGIWGAFENEVLWRSDGLGSSVAYRNNLSVADRGERALVVAGTRHGVVAYQGFGTSNTDVDEDGVLNHLDNCPETANPDQADADGDGVGDACNDEHDSDGDEWADAWDNCPDLENPGQADADGNGVGDACNDAEDGDGDEWADSLDSCPEVANADQADRDGDMMGDACDPYPDNPDNYAARCDEAVENETMLGIALEACEALPKFEDSDADGEADATDACPDTDPGDDVDSAGCSLAQFCSQMNPLSGMMRVMTCLVSDWQNDEPGRLLPADCAIEWRGRRRRTSSMQCIAR